MHRLFRTSGLLALALIAAPAIALAQDAPAAPPQTTQTAQTPPAAAAPAQQDVDREMVASESDFVIVALPTTLPLAPGKWAVRMTHRFSYAINQGSTGDFFRNFFGFDSTPAVALDVRVGLASGSQLSIQRVNDRTIQFLGQNNLVRQTSDSGASIDLLTAVEGANNFSEDFGFTLGAAISHRFADHGAVYADPMVVFNSNPITGATSDNTFMVGSPAPGSASANRRVLWCSEATCRASRASRPARINTASASKNARAATCSS